MLQGEGKNMNSENRVVTKEEQQKAYNEYVKEVTPVHSTALNMLWAFLVGGAICTFGQFVTDSLLGFGIGEKDALGYTSLILILISAVTTGLGWYAKLAKYAGAGAVVPITGFANSVASSAIEFKKEGWVFGVGCRIFQIAGPVILYGIVTSWILGLAYWVILLLR